MRTKVKLDKPDFAGNPHEGPMRTTSAESALAVLLSADFGQLRLVEYYNRLADELGRDFGNIRFVMGFTPLLHDGPEHRRLRKISAEYLRGRAEVLKQFERDASTLIKQKLTKQGRLELISEIIEPLFEMSAEAVSGLPYSPEVTSLFTVNNSLKNLRKMDDALGMLRRVAAERYPEENAETQGIRVAFAIQGEEPLGASLAASFGVLFEGVAGARICDLAWGNSFLATGLAVLGRESKAEPKQMREVDMSHFTKQGGQPNYVFGVGAHACLGRKIALSLHARIGEDMAQNRMRVHHISTKANTHKIMNFPSELIVEMSHE